MPKRPASRPSPTTPGSRLTRSAVPRASTRRATPASSATYADNVAKLLAELAAETDGDRRARFATVALVAFPDGDRGRRPRARSRARSPRPPREPGASATTRSSSPTRATGGPSPRCPPTRSTRSRTGAGPSAPSRRRSDPHGRLRFMARARRKGDLTVARRALLLRHHGGRVLLAAPAGCGPAGPCGGDYERRDTLASLAMGVGSLVAPLASGACSGRSPRAGAATARRSSRRRPRGGRRDDGGRRASLATRRATPRSRPSGAAPPSSATRRRPRPTASAPVGPPRRLGGRGLGGRGRRRGRHDDVGSRAPRPSDCGAAGSSPTSGTVRWRWPRHRRLGLHLLLEPPVHARVAGTCGPIHVVHHSSEHYNLSTALRQPVADALGTFAPLRRVCACSASRPGWSQTARGVNLLYQFWIHTETIGRLGPAEAVLNTPVAPSRAPRVEPAVPRPQPRQHPDRLGPALRHLRARGRATSSTASPRTSTRSTRRGSSPTSTRTCCATWPRRPAGASASPTCSGARGGQPATGPRLRHSPQLDRF